MDGTSRGVGYVARHGDGPTTRVFSARRSDPEIRAPHRFRGRAAYAIQGKDRYGCSAHRSKGICLNARTIKRQAIEERVLAGLKDKLMAPELVAAFVEEYRKETNRLAVEAEQTITAARRQLVQVEKRIAGIVKAIEDGAYNPTLKDRLTELENDKARLETDLAAAPAPSPVRLHPKLSEVYREKVARMEDALNEPDVRAEAAEILRGLIDRIVLYPVDNDVMRAELVGDLAAILNMCEENRKRSSSGSETKRLPEANASRSQLSVVAGARNHLYRTGLIWISRSAKR